MTNSFALEWISVALRLWIWRNFGQCCEYFIWFLYLSTRPAILTAANTKIIFILVRNSNMHGDLYNGVLFNRRYQTQESNEHQPGPSGLVIYPGYQQCQQFRPNVYTSHDESPSRSKSPSSSSGSGSENVNKRWEATEVKILISAYNDHKENLNNSKSSKGKKWETLLQKKNDTSTENCRTAGIVSSRSLTQIKEKWRTLFEKYKVIVDNSKKTVAAENLSCSLRLWMNFLGALTKSSPKVCQANPITGE